MRYKMKKSKRLMIFKFYGKQSEFIELHFKTVRQAFRAFTSKEPTMTDIRGVVLHKSEIQTKLFLAPNACGWDIVRV